MTLAEIQETLRRVQNETGVNPALLYVTFLPDRMGDRKAQRDPKDPCYNPPINSTLPYPEPVKLETTKDVDSCDILELTLVTAKGKPAYIPVKDSGQYIRRKDLKDRVENFRTNISNYNPRNQTKHIDSSKQLYRWLIKPLYDSLKNQAIDNLTLVLPDALRQTPFAALINEQNNYIISDYSVGVMPSLSLTDTRLSSIHDKNLLAIGASRFEKPISQTQLPGVPEELTKITKIWMTQQNLNQDIEQVKDKLYNPIGFGLIHLATHAKFNETNGIGEIYFKNGSFSFNEIRQFNWNNPTVAMLVLSACQTAQGNIKSEQGFAGLAARIGVQSVIGTLWKIGDKESPVFMEKLYQELKFNTKIIKANALKNTQLSLSLSKDPKLSHPSSWSAFTLIGNPW